MKFFTFIPTLPCPDFLRHPSIGLPLNDDGKGGERSNAEWVIEQAPVAINVLRARMRAAKAYNKKQSKAEAKAAGAKAAEVAAAGVETK